MKIEDHLKAIRESLDVIRDCIYIGIENRQRTIGFHCSAAATDLLELFLHSRNAIDPGKILKHDFFASERKSHQHLPEEFEDKEKIISLLVGLEKKRNLLCYGKPKPKEMVEEYLQLFNAFKAIFKEKKVEYE